MYKVSKLLQFIIFADDTNIFYLNKDTGVLIDVINRELLKLSKWFMVNKLFLNVKNLVSMKKTQYKPIVLNGKVLEEVKSTKILGVIIDSQFTWIEHINKFKGKVRIVIGAMYRIRNKVNTKT